MHTYIIKRILLMIPTFFAISLIVFLVLNLAPGKPGGQMASPEGGESDTAGKRESYLIFKHQFNLDKPILFNTRFSLSTEGIEKLLFNIVNENKDVPVKDVIKSQEVLEDYGQYAVPHLIKIINETDNKRIRDKAVDILGQNAKERVIITYGGGKVNEEIKNLNKEIEKENNYIEGLSYSNSDPEETKLEVVSKWGEWYESHKDRYQYNSLQKVWIFFTDTRFSKYWWNLLHLDFGISHVDKQPVIETIFSKLKYSLSLSVSSVIIAYIVSVPLGIFSAVKQNSLTDRIITVILFMLYSLPSFFVATLLLIYFSQAGPYPVFPTGGFISRNASEMTTLSQIKDVIWHLILPIICMTYASFASLSRYARSGLLEVIRSDYIRTARAKGLSEFVVIGKHAVRNGMIPIITLLASILPVVLGGSVIIEYIFGIPGMGLYMIDSIFQRDYNVIMAVQLISAVLLMMGMILADITYALVDPRISFK